ncbi:fructose-6-phosphate aldolase [Candidatus Nitronereus thalassa]|uniref:Probable transaldolase n=1 Tax=Candidatus Nitronereus thalassa TaxID=3020898 RepID=A0ABU3KA65_9BACT|nr:fructose-6-phosphate aldolase [Candidatus Nitronereus thalassa]MDT7043209.1 fructose-6-phosphate aldolase [Candidatus Nitronereus thalassa]
MKLYLDTGNISEIIEAASLGVLDGVTTNPSLIAKEGRDFRELLYEICKLVNGPISAEVVSLEAEAMVKEGKELAKIHKNIVVKCPLTPEGLKATRRLSSEGILVNVTLCFSPTQAILAAKAGAWCVSPFIGRLDDISSHGMELIRQILVIFEKYEYPTQVLVASVRHPQHVLESALLGGHICTIPFTVFQQIIRHPLTDIGLGKFQADWEAKTTTPALLR